MSEQRPEYKIEGRPPTIFRTVHDRDNPYVIIDRRPIDNPKLSFKAKGILTYLLSRPDGWEVNLVDLANRSTEGLSAIKSGVKELKQAGHLKHAGTREADGQFGTVIWEVYEAPQVDNQLTDQPQVGVSPQVGFMSPQVEKPQADKPQADNHMQVLSTLSSNNLIYRARALSKEKIKEITENTEAHILAGMRGAESSWPGREKLPEPIRDLLDVFVKISGIKPTRRQLMDWLGSGQDWLEIGAHPQDISKAYEESKPNEKGLGGFACYRPGSLTGAVQKVVGERRKSNTGMTRLERAQLEIAEMTNGG
jgi:hypothetical protein